jgi:hypothetical protein
MEPPFIRDAHGIEHAAEVSVDGCAYSTNPGPPWQYPVTAPGATSCVIRVRWSIHDYPAELDPAWKSTGPMNVPRAFFHLEPVANDMIAAIGGLTTHNAITNTIELYDASLADKDAGDGKYHQWSRVPSDHGLGMQHPRVHFGAAVLKNGIFVAGGCCDSLTSCHACEAELISTTDWKSTPLHSVGTHAWASAAQVQDDIDGSSSTKVLVIGGVEPIDVFDPDTWTWGQEPLPKEWTTETEFSVTGFDQDPATGVNRALLVCGGLDQNDNPIDVCWVRRNGLWSTFSMSVARHGHIAALTPAGLVILAGGDGLGATAELWDPHDPQKSQPPLPRMLEPRRYAAGAFRKGGVLIVCGGESDGDGSPSDTSEGLNTNNPTGWFSRDNMVHARAHHAMLPVPDNPDHALLAAGGVKVDALTSAELIAPKARGPCSHDGECQSSHCKNGDCCGCIQLCRRCDAGCDPDVNGHDDGCPASNQQHNCGAAGQCGKNGECGEDCGFRACHDFQCSPLICTDDHDCGPGAQCVGKHGASQCQCASDAACQTGHVCSDGKCIPNLFVPAPQQISCTLSSPTAGVGASMLLLAAGLAARRRLQKGKAAKTSGNQSAKGP